MASIFSSWRAWPDAEPSRSTRTRWKRSPGSSRARGFARRVSLPSYGLAEHVLAATFGVRQREPRVDVISAAALSATACRGVC